ncbi:MAG: SEL1-like repeat protein [Bryobacterales bacterium]|nr:SEL1-like repeat protein [Bryobacterales bacterium]
MPGIALLALLWLGLTPALHADLAKGLAAYKAGDFATAQKEFRIAAEAGDSTAMLSLGFLYLHGEGVAVDYKEAVVWLQRAAERGLAPAQHSLAMAYYEGRGVERNTAVAANYFESAALQGLADAQFNLGVLYSRGDGVRQDWVRARFWHEKAAEQGVTDSQVALGVMFANGQGLAKDYPEAARWFGKAAEAGNAKAQRVLETAFRDLPAPLEGPLPGPAPLSSTLSQPSQPAKPLRAAAQAPKPGAAKGPGPVLGRNFWRRAPAPLGAPEFQALQARAVEGEAAAQRDLAVHYYHGASVKRNLVRAYVWAKRAALKGDPGGEAMAKGMYWELDERQRSIAERLLRPPDAP